MVTEKQLIYKNEARAAVLHENPSIVHCIDRLKVVDAVEVVHGRWENVQNGKGCCSNCHRLDSIDSLATHCRYCGAKMGGDWNE